MKRRDSQNGINKVTEKENKVPKLEIDKDFKVFNDPIHGNIRLHPLCVKITDTPQFQRLRFIKQLGGAYFVYPGAAHNRFEHSIGTCHLAGRLVKSLREKLNERDDIPKEHKITSTDELCVQIAALCHDIGHGPFSHLFDVQVVPKLLQGKNKKWKHEQGSIDMLHYMLENKELNEEFKKYGINDTERKFIEEMILGRPNNKEKNNKKPRDSLYEIVSNERNKIDVDKWDYFARDCYMLGIGNNFNHNRCIDFARVVNVKKKVGDELKDDWQICFRDKEAGNLYEMFHTRYMLHQRAYQHKTNNIIEIMLAEALVSANKSLSFPGKNGEACTMSDVIEKNDMMAYCHFTDDIILQILRSTDEELEMSKGIIERVFNRELYAFVGQKRFGAGQFKDKDEVTKNIKDVTKTEVDDKIIVDLVSFDYGMKERNPIDEVNFYSKKNPDEAERIEKGNVSLLLPKYFAEQLVRVYCKEPGLHMEDLKDVFKKWSEETTWRKDIAKAEPSQE